MTPENQTKEPIIQSRLNKALIDKWQFMFQLPEALQKFHNDTVSNKTINKKSVLFSLQKVKMPGTSIKGISQKFAGSNLYVSSHVKEPYDMLEIGFHVDNRYDNYMSIYSWLNLLMDEKEGIQDANNLLQQGNILLRDYWTDLGLVLLDEYNKPIIQATFTKAFPTKITGIEFDYTKDNQILVTANFAFSQFFLNKPDSDTVNYLS